MKKIIIPLLCLSINLFGQIPSYVSTNGLIAYYPFNGNANDLSGNGYNGTVNVATLSTDRFGNLNSCYSFNGLSSYIQTSALQVNITKYSISAWFKTLNGGSIVCGRGTSSSTGMTLVMHNTSTDNTNPYTILYRADGNGSASGIRTINQFNDNQWHHVVGVWNGSSGSVNPSDFSIYIDGNLINSVSESASTINAPFSSTNALYIGKHSSWNSFFDGLIDDVILYNRALTPCEITELYNSSNTNITTQPQSQNIAVNSNVQFIVQASGANTYQWYQNSGTGFSQLYNVGPYTGVTSPTLSISNVQFSMNNYQYECVITNGNCTYTTNPVTLTTYTNTNVPELNKHLVYVYPNPVKDKLYINSSNIESVQIMDLNGNVLIETKNEEINLNEIVSGIYFISVLTKDKVYYDKIIKE